MACFDLFIGNMSFVLVLEINFTYQCFLRSGRTDLAIMQLTQTKNVLYFL